MTKFIPIFLNSFYNDVPHGLLQRIDRHPAPKYYNRVYLCIEDLTPTNVTNHNMPIRGFICKKFGDFEFADEYYQNMPNKDNIRSAMIPICKWSPSWLDKYILDFRLKKMFWLGRHRVYK